MDMLKSYNVDFGFLSETWFPSSECFAKSLVQSYGYTVFHSKQYGRAKGCGVFVSKKHEEHCSKIVHFKYSAFEAILLV